MCGNLNCILIYNSLATILSEKKDIEFISIVVQILNLILLTAPELSPLRSYLQKKDITHLLIQESKGNFDYNNYYY